MNSLQTVGYSARYYSNVIKLLVSIMMGSGRAPLVVTKTVRELMFEGYDDGLLKLVRENNNPDLPKVSFTFRVFHFLSNQNE